MLKLIQFSMAWASLVKRPKVIVTWLRWWLGAVRQQTIIWASVDPDLFQHMASLGHTELIDLVMPTPEL